MNEAAFNVLLVILLYLLALAGTAWRRKTVTVGIAGIALYLLIGIAAYVDYVFFDGAMEYSDIPLAPLLYAWAMSIVLLWPLIRFRDEKIRALLSLDDRTLALGLWVLLGLFLAVNLAILPRTLSDVAQAWNGDALEMYNMRRSGNLMKSELSFGVGNALSVVAKAFGEIVLFFFFHALADSRKRKLAVGLGVCSVFPLLDTLSGAGRNGLVTFGMNLVFLWLLFRNLMAPKVKRLVFLVAVGALVVVVGGIGAITMSRFGDRGAYWAWRSVARYAGQPLLNFANYIPEAKEMSWGDNTFPAVRMVFGLSKIVNRDAFRLVWENRLGIPMSIFYTVVGDFVVDFGWVGAAVLFVLFAWWATARTRMDRNGRVALHTLFVVYAVFLVVCHGIFYFTYKTFAGNMKVFAMVFTYFGLRFLAAKRTPGTPAGGV